MGDLDLPNRIVMAPLTRMRAGIDHVPTALQAEYYAQRASAGLIVAEATAISPDGFGWADTPGLWSAEQVRGWRRVTDAVHAAGGRIIAQLWHTGPIAHPDMRGGA
jgi:N-ethylmaleimide reductase